MPYEAAKLTIQTVGTLTSRRLYWEWHDEVQPYYIPKMPHRVYPEWTSWNDFLGVDNAWDGYDRQNKPRQWMPYWEAVRFVQKLELKSKAEYTQACKDGVIPDTIPRWPEATYGDDWSGWPSFLGTNIMKKVESAEKVVGIIALCVSNLMPPNVLEVVIAPEGRGQLQDKLESRSELRPLKMYVWEANLWPQVKRSLDILGSEQTPGVYLFPNVNAVWYELDSVLLMYR